VTVPVVKWGFRGRLCPGPGNDGVTLPREVDELVMPLCQVCLAPPRQVNQGDVNRLIHRVRAVAQESSQEVKNRNCSGTIDPDLLVMLLAESGGCSAGQSSVEMQAMKL
jgi:hypothetical protein